MVMFIRFSKIKRYILIGGLIILFGFVISSWNKNIRTMDVFVSKGTNVKLESEIQEIFNKKDKAVLEGDGEGLKGIYNREGQKGLWAYENEIHRMKYLNQWINKQSARWSKIQSKVFLRRTKKNGDGYSVNLAITTEYEYIYSDSTKESNSFRICTYPSLDLVPRGDSWMVTMEWYSDPFINAFNMDTIDIEEIRQIILSGGKRDILNLSDRRLGVVKYVDEYSGVAKPPDYNFQYNSKYKNYNFLGGNCTNFASQTLYEGGGFSKTPTWNYSNGEGSRAWVNATDFNHYMLYSGRASLISKGTYEEVLKNSYKLLPGDYIAYEKKGKVAHIGIVSGIDSKGYSLVNTHNPDFHRVPWDLGWKGNGIKFWLVHVHY